MVYAQLLETASSVTSASSQAAADQNPTSNLLLNIGLIAVMLVAMYFILIRPQRKKQKEEVKMRDSLNVGDEIVTIGGIVGRIVSMKEDTLLVETGADRDKIRVMKWAVQLNKSAAQENASSVKKEDPKTK